MQKPRPKSTSSSRVIETKRREPIPGASTSGNNSGVETRNKPRGGSSSDDAKRKDKNRRSNISF